MELEEDVAEAAAKGKPLVEQCQHNVAQLERASSQTRFLVTVYSDALSPEPLMPISSQPVRLR